MSDRARELAEQVNQRSTQQTLGGELQLHRHKILQSKGLAFWETFKTVAQDECDEFNRTLKDSEHKIEKLDKTTIPFSMTFHGTNGTTGRITCNLEGQAVSAGCRPVPPRTGSLSKAFGLTVDGHDNIRLESSEGGPLTQADVVLEVLQHMAGV